LTKINSEIIDEVEIGICTLFYYSNLCCFDENLPITQKIAFEEQNLIFVDFVNSDNDFKIFEIIDTTPIILDTISIIIPNMDLKYQSYITHFENKREYVLLKLFKETKELKIRLFEWVTETNFNFSVFNTGMFYNGKNYLQSEILDQLLIQQKDFNFINFTIKFMKEKNIISEKKKKIPFY